MHLCTFIGCQGRNKGFAGGLNYVAYSEKPTARNILEVKMRPEPHNSDAPKYAMVSILHPESFASSLPTFRSIAHPFELLPAVDKFLISMLSVEPYGQSVL